MSSPRRLGLSVLTMCFTLVFGASPARGLVFAPDFPGATFGTLTIPEIPSEPVLLSFAPQPGPAPAIFFLTLSNTSSDTLTAVDLELGQTLDGVFQADDSGGATFLAAPGAATLGPDAASFKTLSADATATSLDLNQAFIAANRVPADGSPAGLVTDDALTLDFFVISDGVSPLDFRLTLAALPEPATLALALMGMGAALRRPLRRV